MTPIPNSSTERLARRVEELNADLRRLTAEFRRRTAIIAIGFGLLILLLIGAIAATYRVSLDNARQIKANNTKLCPILLVNVQKPGDAPPSTPRGQQVVKEARDLAVQFGCLR